MPFEKGSTISLGKKTSEETRQKQSLAHKGCRPYEWGAGFKKGNSPWNARNKVARNAYYAGLVDGEGHIAIQGNGPNRQRYGRICVRITQKENTSLLDGYNHWGGYLYHRTRGGRIFYEWVLQHGSAGKFLEDVKPFLKIKVEEAEIALKYRWLQIRKRSIRKITDSDLYYRKELEQKLKSLHLPKGNHISS